MLVVPMVHEVYKNSLLLSYNFHELSQTEWTRTTLISCSLLGLWIHMWSYSKMWRFNKSHRHRTREPSEIIQQWLYNVVLC